MLTEHKLQKVISDLTQGATSTMQIQGHLLTFFWVGQPSVLTIKTPVYCGENYIPASVRGSLPQAKNRHGYFSVDEDQFEISMLAEVDTYALSDREFEGFVSDFCHRAEMWRTRLDGRDRNDLVYVRIPR